jgi:mono/diheme cytochrome c family protein
MVPRTQDGTSSSGKHRWRYVSIVLIATTVVLIGGTVGYAADRYRPNRLVDLEDPVEHFKYGSIGGDVENGLPLEIMKILPRAFPQYLPKGAAQDYTAFGFIQEPGHAMPIGFSTRQVYVPVTGLTCSACHTGTMRASADEAPHVYLGMGAKTLDLESYFKFLFDCAGDPRFTPEYLIPIMQANGANLNAVDRVFYSRLVIPTMKQRLTAAKAQFADLFANEPDFGPGRVDTFNPYKANQLREHYADGIPKEESVGIAAYPAIWNQRVRRGMAMNWDGNSPRKKDRDIGAAFGAGATRESVDTASIARISDWLRDLPAPAYPWGIDSTKVARGAQVFAQSCATCHAIGGALTGKVDPLSSVKTDPHRLRSYTAKLNQLLLDYGNGYGWKLTDMTTTDGYANKPLDGVWARAPYLHNGSVPTLVDLLTPEDQRNGGKPTFYVGHAVYDTVNVGIRTDVAEVDGRPSAVFDTRLPGNSNLGHSGPLYGTNLSAADKRALIEYLKTLR